MHRSRLYGLFIDTPTDQAEQSHRFWSAALGVPAQPVPGEEQFTMLPGVLGDLVVGVQAVADAPRYHLDIETDDVDAEVARLTALGAVEVARWLDCHVLRAPGGHLLCVIPVHSDPALFAAEAKVWNTYRYIGPAELRGISGPNPASITVESTSALAAWLNASRTLHTRDCFQPVHRVRAAQHCARQRLHLRGLRQPAAESASLTVAVRPRYRS